MCVNPLPLAPLDLTGRFIAPPKSTLSLAPTPPCPVRKSEQTHTSKFCLFHSSSERSYSMFLCAFTITTDITVLYNFGHQIVELCLYELLVDILIISFSLIPASSTFGSNSTQWKMWHSCYYLIFQMICSSRGLSYSATRWFGPFVFSNAGHGRQRVSVRNWNGLYVSPIILFALPFLVWRTIDLLGS